MLNRAYFSLIILPLCVLLIALKLGTLALLSGGQETQLANSFGLVFGSDLISWTTFDVLRLELGFVLFIVCWNLIVLSPGLPLMYLRRVIAMPLTLMILALALIGTSSAQAISEGSAYHKVMYFLNYQTYWGVNQNTIGLFNLTMTPLVCVGSIVFCFWLSSQSRLKMLANEEYRQLPPPPTMRIVTCSVLCGIGSVASFISPLQTDIRTSLAYNSYVYFLKTGWFPQKNIYSYQRQSHFPSWNFKKAKHVVKQQKNVVIITLESVRHDVLSLDEADTLSPQITPFLNKLSQSSVVYSNAYTTLPHTSKALVGIHCGIAPYIDLPLYESTMGIPVNCLPNILEDKGYRTVFFQSPTQYYENRRELVEKFGFQQYFTAEELANDNFELVNRWGFEDKIMVEPIREWIKEHKIKQKNLQQRQPFLLSLLTITSHHDYHTPTTFEQKEYVADERYNRYLNAVHYTDQFVEDIINIFKEQQLYDETLFVIVSDHGEAFGEHGLNFHNRILYDEGSKVLMIWHSKETRQFPKYQHQVVSHLHMLPTILDQLGYKNENNKNLLRANNTTLGPLKLFNFESVKQNTANLEQEPIYMSCYERLNCIAIVHWPYKYIYFFEDKKAELFNLSDDREEKINLVEQYPHRVTLLHRQLMAWYDQQWSSYHNYFAAIDVGYFDKSDETVLYTYQDYLESTQYYKYWQARERKLAEGMKVTADANNNN